MGNQSTFLFKQNLEISIRSRMGHEDNPIDVIGKISNGCTIDSFHHHNMNEQEQECQAPFIFVVARMNSLRTDHDSPPIVPTDDIS